MLDNKKAIVTGGCGFIGSHMVDRLISEGYDVTVLDNLSSGRLQNLEQHKNNKNLKIIEIDISDLEGIKKHFNGIDVVYHLAALADIVPSIVNPLNYYKSNVTGTTAVVEASRLANVKKIIYAASSSCYGIPDVFPTPESAEIRPPISLRFN
jgi:UDP-glucose 4-epimerase